MQYKTYCVNSGETKIYVHINCFDKLFRIHQSHVYALRKMYPGVMYTLHICSGSIQVVYYFSLIYYYSGLAYNCIRRALCAAVQYRKKKKNYNYILHTKPMKGH